MIDPERLAAFALMTGVASLVPGVSMLFVMAETLRRGWRDGAAALAGLQLGYIGWWLLAGLGLGTLATVFPSAFFALAIAGVAYLGWLGIDAIRHARDLPTSEPAAVTPRSQRSFTAGVLVALGNPKSLIYIVALLPPFVDARAAVGPQLVILAGVAMAIDVAMGALYIGAGQRLAAAMERPATRTAVQRSIGALYLLIAGGILIDILLR